MVDSDGVTATLFGVPPATGDGERTSPLSPRAEENIVAGNRGAKRTCALKENTSAEDAPRKKVKKRDDSINKEVPTTAPLPMSANGCTPHANREFREQPREEPYVFETPVKARAVEELLCAHQQLSKCIENQDYMGAAAAKENIDALTTKVRTTVPLSMPANGGTPQASRELREQPREEPYVFETPVKARAVEELPCAQQQLSKCLENQDYLGAAAARENIDALTAKGRALRFF